MQASPVHGLDGRLLRLFLEVYECKSVSRAAERLDLTQSTVSHGLDRLRRALNDPLFVKDGRNITPTIHADYLAPRIRGALTAIEGLSEPDAYLPQTDSHPFTVAANPHELQPQLTMLFRILREQAPRMPVRFIHLGTGTNIRAILESGTADLAIAVRRGAPPPELDVAHYLTDRLVTFYDPAMRGPITSLEDFAQAHHAALDFGFGRPSILEQRLNDLEIDREVYLHAATLPLLAEMIRGSDLVTTMQSRFVDGVFDGLEWSELPFEMPLIRYDLIWHKRLSLSHRHEWLRAIAKSTWTEPPATAETRIAAAS